MEYVINDFSLPGQFANEDAFYDSIGKYTLPVLKKIEKEKDSIIWKKDTLWNQEVCPGITLGKLRPRRNERNIELTLLKQKLQKLYTTVPFWKEEEEIPVLVIRYCFDEEAANEFPMMNCFVKAWVRKGKIISFEHSEYQEVELSFYIEQDDKEVMCSLDNIVSTEFWNAVREIRKWPKIKGLYKVEVRAHEVDRHIPHFHVTYNEYTASFAISDGSMQVQGKLEMPGSMIAEIHTWYLEHKEELEEAWKLLHEPLFV